MKILVINGPNLNNLGSRDTSLYGKKTLIQINDDLLNLSEKMNVDLSFFQSNHEGDLIDFIQQNTPLANGILINAGAITHYGLSLKDAIIDSKLPVVETHLSNIHSREDYRRVSVLESVSVGQVAGFGWKSYVYALYLLVDYLNRDN
ncbi:MAG: type II 3-dehydroquinate dehydratase [Dehalococcoidia bacterium]